MRPCAGGHRTAAGWCAAGLCQHGPLLGATVPGAVGRARAHRLAGEQRPPPPRSARSGAARRERRTLRTPLSDREARALAPGSAAAFARRRSPVRSRLAPSRRSLRGCQRRWGASGRCKGRGRSRVSQARFLMAARGPRKTRPCGLPSPNKQPAGHSVAGRIDRLQVTLDGACLRPDQ